jgi:hypothetical protein
MGKIIAISGTECPCAGDPPVPQYGPLLWGVAILTVVGIFIATLQQTKEKRP